MVVDTAGKGMREGSLGVVRWKGSNVYMLVAVIVVVAEESGYSLLMRANKLETAV